jgi:hypothetical protein
VSTITDILPSSGTIAASVPAGSVVSAAVTGTLEEVELDSALPQALDSSIPAEMTMIHRVGRMAHLTSPPAIRS